MHIISDPSMKRPGYRYTEGNLLIGYPEGTQPHIVWNHIDGPLLYRSDGQLHWLTLWERLRCWLGLDDVHSLDAKLKE